MNGPGMRKRSGVGACFTRMSAGDAASPFCGIWIDKACDMMGAQMGRRPEVPPHDPRPGGLWASGPPRLTHLCTLSLVSAFEETREGRV